MLDKKNQLKDLAVKAESLSLKYFRVHQDVLRDKKHNIESALKIVVTKNKEFIKRSLDNLNTSLNKIFNNSREQIRYLDQKTKILNPESALKRGYSITLKEGRSVKSIDDLRENDLIKTIFYKGSVVSKVRRIKDKG